MRLRRVGIEICLIQTTARVISGDSFVFVTQFDTQRVSVSGVPLR